MKSALLQMHAAVLLWGFTGVLGVAISVDAPVLVWYRTLLTALFMAVILVYRKKWQRVERRDMGTLITVGCLMGIHWVAFYAAIKFSNASIALVCLSTASVFTSLLDPWVNKGQHKLSEVLLGVLALAGVYLIYQFQDFYAKGIFFGVIAAILSSIFTVLNKRIAHKYEARVMVFYEMTAGWLLVSLLIAGLFAFNLQGWLATPGKASATLALIPVGYDWLWLVILALCCTVWAQSLALTALKHLSSFTATLSVNLEPVYGIILAFIFFHENKQVGWGFYAGVGLILLSVALQMFSILRPGLSPGFLKEKGGIEQ